MNPRIADIKSAMLQAYISHIILSFFLFLGFLSLYSPNIAVLLFLIAVVFVTLGELLRRRHNAHAIMINEDFYGAFENWLNSIIVYMGQENSNLKFSIKEWLYSSDNNHFERRVILENIGRIENKERTALLNSLRNQIGSIGEKLDDDHAYFLILRIMGPLPIAIGFMLGKMSPLLLSILSLFILWMPFFIVLLQDSSIYREFAVSELIDISDTLILQRILASLKLNHPIQSSLVNAYQEYSLVIANQNILGNWLSLLKDPGFSLQPLSLIVESILFLPHSMCVRALILLIDQVELLEKHIDMIRVKWNVLRFRTTIMSLLGSFTTALMFSLTPFFASVLNNASTDLEILARISGISLTFSTISAIYSKKNSRWLFYLLLTTFMWLFTETIIRSIFIGY